MRIVTYNLNGIRSANKKGLSEWINNTNYDIFCFQETRASLEQIEKELVDIKGYFKYFNVAEKKGYSGTGILTKIKPLKVFYNLPRSRTDFEGRILGLEFDDFFLIDLYAPNGSNRLHFKLEFMTDFLQDIKDLMKQNKEIIICTDFNISHTEKDLLSPKMCENKTGYLPEERKLFDDYIEAGLFDTFRTLYPEEQVFTWSSYKAKVQGNSVGCLYRFDYIFATKKLTDCATYSQTLYDINYSDHYPVVTEFLL